MKILDADNLISVIDEQLNSIKRNDATTIIGREATLIFIKNKILSLSTNTLGSDVDIKTLAEKRFPNRDKAGVQYDFNADARAGFIEGFKACQLLFPTHPVSQEGIKDTCSRICACNYETNNYNQWLTHIAACPKYFNKHIHKSDSKISDKDKSLEIQKEFYNWSDTAIEGDITRLDCEHIIDFLFPKFLSLYSTTEEYFSLQQVHNAINMARGITIQEGGNKHHYHHSNLEIVEQIKSFPSQSLDNNKRIKEEPMMKVMEYLYGAKNNFPDAPKSIPMRFLSEKWAQSNHSQTLKRLNERGGLTVTEILDNIKGQPLTLAYRVATREDVDELKRIINSQ